MNNEQHFLVTYGLHHFVSFTGRGDKGVFTICREEGQKMARHAVSLITGRYGDGTRILMV